MAANAIVRKRSDFMAHGRFGVADHECNGFPVGESGSKTHAKPLCTVQGVAVLSSRLIPSSQPKTEYREQINRESSVGAPLCRSTPKCAWPRGGGHTCLLFIKAPKGRDGIARGVSPGFLAVKIISPNGATLIPERIFLCRPVGAWLDFLAGTQG